jgi:SAM-dependent methyltransferase
MMTDALTQETELEIALKDQEYEAMPEVFTPQPAGWRSELLDRMEIPPHLEALRPLEGRRVLEIGCGDGRFTTLMSQLGADVLAVDFSLAGLQRVKKNLQSGVAPTTYKVPRPRTPGTPAGRVGLVQADASKFHVAPCSFDRALSATPLDSRDERMRMYHTVAESLNDSGRYVAGVEHDDLHRRILGLPMIRRYTAGGVLIEHLDIPTMRREIAPYFRRIRIRSIRAHLPFVRRLQPPIAVTVAVSRVCCAIPGLRHLGEILVACAERPIRIPVEGARRPDFLNARSLYRRYKRWRGEEATWDGSELL